MKTNAPIPVNMILTNGRITTLSRLQQEVQALAISEGKILKIGTNGDILQLASPETKIIDLKGKRAIPGLNDSHLHLIRGGLNFNMELRWDGVTSLSDALAMLKDQAMRTPSPQWVRVVGGWSEFQFKEKRLPTLAELNMVSPNTPVFILHLYDRALLNQAALKAAGIDKNSPDPIGGHIERDKSGNPTGMLIAEPNALLLYSTLAKGPKLGMADQINSTQHFMKELNRLGVTSVIDAGGGFQNYPDDYQVIEHLNQSGQMTVRIAYNLFTQNPGEELKDFQKWVSTTKPYSGNDMYRHNGAGEMLVFSAADFEDFLQPRPDMPSNMETNLRDVAQLLVSNRWPFRLHATYNETIERALTVFESVNKEIPFQDLQWTFDHAETVTEQSLGRIKALGGSIAIQNRMAFQGEYFIERYGMTAAKQSPPIRKMLNMGIPIGAGTDATRVSSYNPWLSLYWLVSGKTIGGQTLYGDDNKLEREEALRLWTQGSAKLSREDQVKGTLSPGMYADIAVLSSDYMTIPDEEIKNLSSILTILGGKVVYGADQFAQLDTPLTPAKPDWSPVNHYMSYEGHALPHQSCTVHSPSCHKGMEKPPEKGYKFINPWAFGCGCFSY